MAITVEELLVEFKADSARFAQEHRRVQESILKSEAASLRLQRSLDKLQGTRPPDLGAKSARDAAQSYGNLAEQLGTLSSARLGGVGAVAAGFLTAAKAGIQYRDTLEKLNRSFLTLTGSQEAAARHLKDLHAFAAATPFEFEETARASQRFQAMGVAAKEVVPYLTAVGNAVAKTGQGSEAIDRVSLALAQVSARGKVSAQEMNQLANSLVDGWGPVQVELGKTRAEVMKMAEEGNISAETFLRAFRKAHEGGRAMQDQMNTLSGALSTLKDTGKLALADFFDPLYQQLRIIAVGLADVSRGAGTAQGALMKAAESYAYWEQAVHGESPGQMQRRLAGESGFTRAAPSGIASVFSAAEAEQAKRRQVEINKWIDDSVKAWFELKKATKPAEDAMRNLQSQVRSFGDETALGQVTEKFRMMREEFERMGSNAPEGWAGELSKIEAEARRQAQALDMLKDAQKAQKEAEQEAKRAREQSLDGLRNAMIDVQNFGKSEAEAAVNTMKWAAGIRDLNEATKQLSLADIITATGMQINDLEGKKNLADLNEGLTDLTKEFSAQQTAVSRVNDLMDEYVRKMLKLSDSVPPLSDNLAAAFLNARRLAEVADLLNYKPAWEGFKLSDLKPGDTSRITPAGGDGAALQPIQFDVSWMKTFEEEWHNGLLDMREDGQLIFSDFFLDLQNGWKGALGNMGLAFLQSLQQMAANAAASAVWGWILQAAGAIAGGAISGGGSSAGGAGSFMGANIPAFATGGSFMVGGGGGTDSQLVMFRATPGERVDVRTPGQQTAAGGPSEVHIHVHGVQNPAQFLSRETATQIRRKYRREMMGEAARTGGR